MFAGVDRTTGGAVGHTDDTGNRDSTYVCRLYITMYRRAYSSVGAIKWRRVEIGMRGSAYSQVGEIRE